MVSHAYTAGLFEKEQKRIISVLEGFESDASFNLKPWQKAPDERLQGEGCMALLLEGDVIEKGGVNFSNVYGSFEEELARNIPGADESQGQFSATGVSLVIHPRNPFCPTVHMNVRRIETARSWFGGGADLTPCLPFTEDTQRFHEALKEATEAHHEGAYEEYKAWADEYFFIPHRDEPRGVGGTFFDYVNSGDDEKDLNLALNTIEAFLTAYVDILHRRKDTPYDDEQRRIQTEKRGRYVEFNLLYDSGTKFGFQTGGNPEAILMSMPPVASWAA